MSLNDIDLSQVEESKDFGAIKAVVTKLRVTGITKEKPKNPNATYSEFYKVTTEFVDRSTVETVDPTTTASSPIVNLYTHNAGSLGMLRTFIEAHGVAWADFVSSSDREAFLQGLIGTEATAKIGLILNNKETGEVLDNPRNEVRYRKLKKA